MQYAFLGLALAASVYAQGVSDPLYPSGVNGPPSNSNYPKNAFILQTVPLNESNFEANKPYFTNTPVNCTTISPKIALIGSALNDERGSTGSIVANDQFQFDGPPQAGVKVSAGWYRNPNATLALGTANDAAVFYRCDSGNLVNLYRTSIGLQCYPIYLVLSLCESSTTCGVNYTVAAPPNTTPFKIPKADKDESLFAGNTPPPSTCPGAPQPPGGSATAAAPSSTAAAAATKAPSSAAAVATSAAPATMLQPPTGMQALPSAVGAGPIAAAPSAPAAAAAPAPAPAAAGNGTAAAGTGAAKPPTSSSSPVPFTNAAPAVAVGQKAGAFLAVVAAAFALA